MTMVKFVTHGILPIAIFAVLAFLIQGDGPADAGHGSTPGVVDFVSIDMDTTGNSPNGPLGTRETCVAVSSPGSVTIDVTVDEVDAADTMSALSFDLNYDATVVTIASNDVSGQMLGVNALSNVIDVSDPTPDSDGVMGVAAGDLAGAPSAFESGSGVLARLTLDTAGPGLTNLTLTNTAVLDDVSAAIPINTIQDNTIVVVDGVCPPAGPYVVDTTSDAFTNACTGAAADCSLRGAMANAAALNGAQTITFDATVFPPAAPAGISLGSALPDLSDDGDTIDATAAGVSVQGMGAGFDCFTISGDGNTIVGIEKVIGCANGFVISGSGNTIGGVNSAESGGDCSNSVDDDDDGYVNDGCPQSGATAESGSECTAGDITNDDGGDDSDVNDGCPARGEGITINAHTSRGIEISGSGATGNFVLGNYIGTDADGVAAAANGGAGVRISSDASNNTIGGTTAGERNILSGNGTYGVNVVGASSTGNVVAGNYIGTDATGTSNLGNTDAGVNIAGPGNTVGGAFNEGNVISTNGAEGVSISGVAATGNTVASNYVGTDYTGLLKLGNTLDGVIIIGPTNNTVGPGNFISGNSGGGVRITGSTTDSNTVKGNFIGINSNGDTALANTLEGVIVAGGSFNTIGGPTAGERNVISGNGDSGIIIDGATATDNTVSGNYIGTNSFGTTAIANLDGVLMSAGASSNTIGGTTAGDRNVISGNVSNGVNITGSGTDLNTVSGNYIGTNAAGTAAVANTAGVRIESSATLNTIGGDVAGAGNVISGNSIGVWIVGSGVSGNKIEGNYIGTNAAGTDAIGNPLGGVIIETGASGNFIGGAAAGKRNVISGNGFGVVITGIGTTSNTIYGNYVGTDATGTSALANVIDGVQIAGGPSGNIVGGTGAGEGNTIAFNGSNGVCVTGEFTDDNSIRGNSIHSNTLLGINLTDDGPEEICSEGTVTANDAGDTDDQANELMNFPVITSATFDGLNTTVTGTLDTGSPATAAVDVYTTDTPDPSGNGEGRVYLGSATPTGGGAWTLIVGGLSPYPYFSATATDASGNTSEFSVVPDADYDGDGFPNSTDNCPGDFNPLQFDHDGDSIGAVCDPIVRSLYTATSSSLVAELTIPSDETLTSDSRTFVSWDFEALSTIGGVTGDIDLSLNLAGTGGDCGVGLSFPDITMLNASTLITDTLPTSGLLLDVSPANGIPDGAEKYPEFLNTMFDPDRRTNVDEDGDGSVDEDVADGVDNDADTLIDEDGVSTPPTLPTPHARRFGTYGPGQFVQLVIFEVVPDTLYETKVVFNDPTAAFAPGSLAPCGSLEIRVTTLDTTTENASATPTVPGGDALLTTPAPGTYLQRIQLVDQPDVDGDGVENLLDNCPETANASQADADADAIGDACEPVSGPCFATAVADCDGDGHFNVADNCPTIPNASQEESEIRTPEPFGIAPINDRIGDACDANPTLIDMGQLTRLREFSDPICVTGGGFADVDGDGWCVPGADPNDNDPTVTPEDDSVAPGSCFNAVDDDGDTSVDAADSACADADGDGVPDNVDNCAAAANPLQLDANTATAAGDACEATNVAETTVVSTTDGANAELRHRLVEVAPQPLHRDDGIILFTDADWGITSGASVSDGALVGALTSTLTVALDPVPVCNQVFTRNFQLVNASTDPLDTIDPGANFSSLVADGDSNGLSDGAEQYPDFLLKLGQASAQIDNDADLATDEDPIDGIDNDQDGSIDEDPFDHEAPLARMFGSTQFQGANYVVNVLVYSPGDLPAFPASQGYPALIIINDPSTPSGSGNVNAFCSSQDHRLFRYGVSLDNPATGANESGVGLLTNDSAAVTEQFSVQVSRLPDLDGDGIENYLDVCTFEPDNDFDGTADDVDASPWNPRLVSPPGDPDADGLPTGCDRPEDYPPAAGECANAADDDFDGSVNDGCPAVAAPETGAQCANSTDDDSDTFVNDGCPSVGNPIVPSPPGSGPDEDGDGFANDLDNCPNTANADQTDSDADGIGDICDPDPLLPEGSAQTVINGTPVCTGGVDADKDGYCTDIDGNDNDEKVVPEASAYDPSVCGDFVDNDGDFDIDLDDDGCGDLDVDGVLNELDNCPTVANPDQEDSDSDTSSSIGQQPFLASGIGDPPVQGNPFLASDRFGGDACDPDDDNDGLADGSEAAVQCSTDTDCDDDRVNDLMEFTWPCLDPLDTTTNGSNPDATHDFDGDGLPNLVETLIGKDPCVFDASVDPDGDGYASNVELYLGTDPFDPCANTATANDEADDRWAPDFDDNKIINIIDVLALKPVFNTSYGDPGFVRRRDLSPNLTINIIDVLALKPVFNVSCT